MPYQVLATEISATTDQLEDKLKQAEDLIISRLVRPSWEANLNLNVSGMASGVRAVSNAISNIEGTAHLAVDVAAAPAIRNLERVADAADNAVRATQRVNKPQGNLGGVSEARAEALERELDLTEQISAAQLEQARSRERAHQKMMRDHPQGGTYMDAAEREAEARLNAYNRKVAGLQREMVKSGLSESIGQLDWSQGNLDGTITKVRTLILAQREAAKEQQRVNAEWESFVRGSDKAAIALNKTVAQDQKRLAAATADVVRERQRFNQALNQVTVNQAGRQLTDVGGVLQNAIREREAAQKFEGNRLFQETERDMQRAGVAVDRFGDLTQAMVRKADAEQKQLTAAIQQTTRAQEQFNEAFERVQRMPTANVQGDITPALQRGVREREELERRLQQQMIGGIAAKESAAQGILGKGLNNQAVKELADDLSRTDDLLRDASAETKTLDHMLRRSRQAASDLNAELRKNANRTPGMTPTAFAAAGGGAGGGGGGRGRVGGGAAGGGGGGFDPNAVRGMNQAWRDLGSEVNTTNGILQKAYRTVLAFGTGYLIIHSLGVAWRNLREAIIDFPAEIEQIRVGFVGLFNGSQQRADELLATLKQFAIPTPFEMADLAPLAQQSIAFGLINKNSQNAARETVELLRDVGDAAYGLNRGQEGVQRLVLALGQMRVANRVMGQEMLQMQQLGINAWEYLANALGKTTRETRDLVSKGLIPADQAIKAIRHGLREDFGGAMERASMTLNGAMSRIRDTLLVNFSEATAPMFARISQQVVSMAETMDSPQNKQRIEAVGRFLTTTFERVSDVASHAYNIVSNNAGHFSAAASAANSLTPVLSAVAIAYTAVRVQANLAAIAAAWQGSANVVGNLQKLVFALGQVTLAYRTLGAEAARSQVTTLFPALGNPALLLASLAAVTVAAGAGAIMWQKYNENVAIATGAQADLDYATGQLKDTFQDLERFIGASPAGTKMVADLNSQFQELGGTVQGLKRLSGVILPQVKEKIRIGTDLEPVDRSLVNRRVKELEDQLKQSEIKMQIAVDAQADLNPASLNNLREAFKDFYGRDAFDLKNLQSGFIVFNSIYYTLRAIYDSTSEIRQSVVGWVRPLWDAVDGARQLHKDMLAGAGSWGQTLVGWIDHAETRINQLGRGIMTTGQRLWENAQRFVTGQNTLPLFPEPAKPSSNLFTAPSAAEARAAQEARARRMIERINERNEIREFERKQRETESPKITLGGETEDKKKAREKRERDKRIAAWKKMQIDMLSDTERMYNQMAKAAEESAKRQMDALTGLRDGLRDLFGGVQDELAQLGNFNNPLGGWVRQFEQFFNIGGKMRQVESQRSAEVGFLSGMAGSVASRRDRMQGGDGSNPQYSGPVSNKAMAIAQVAMQRHLRGSAEQFRGWCQKLLRTTVQQVTPEFNEFFGGSAREVMNKFKAAGVGGTPNQMGGLRPGDLAYTGRWGGRSGHAMVVGPDGQIIDNVGSGRAPAHKRPVDWVVRPGGAQMGEPGGVQRKLYGAGALPPTFAQDFEQAQFQIDGTLDRMGRLPKEWGAAVKDTESTTNRFRAQMYLVSEAGQRMLAALTPKQRIEFFKGAGDRPGFRQFFNLADAMKSASINTEAWQQKLVEAQRTFNEFRRNIQSRIRMSGRENDPVAQLKDQFITDENWQRVSPAQRNRAVQDAQFAQAWELARATREYNQAQRDAMAIEAVRGRALEQFGDDTVSVQRAVDLATEKQRIWNELTQQAIPFEQRRAATLNRLATFTEQYDAAIGGGATAEHNAAVRQLERDYVALNDTTLLAIATAEVEAEARQRRMTQAQKETEIQLRLRNAIAATNREQANAARERSNELQDRLASINGETPEQGVARFYERLNEDNNRLQKPLDPNLVAWEYFERTLARSLHSAESFRDVQDEVRGLMGDTELSLERIAGFYDDIASRIARGDLAPDAMPLPDVRTELERRATGINFSGQLQGPLEELTRLQDEVNGSLDDLRTRRMGNITRQLRDVEDQSSLFESIVEGARIAGIDLGEFGQNIDETRYRLDRLRESVAQAGNESRNANFQDAFRALRQERDVLNAPNQFERDMLAHRQELEAMVEREEITNAQLEILYRERRNITRFEAAQDWAQGLADRIDMAFTSGDLDRAMLELKQQWLRDGTFTEPEINAMLQKERWVAALEDVGQSFKGIFQDVFSSGEGGFKGLLDRLGSGITNWANRVFGEILASNVTNRFRGLFEKIGGFIGGNPNATIPGIAGPTGIPNPLFTPGFVQQGLGESMTRTATDSANSAVITSAIGTASAALTSSAGLISAGGTSLTGAATMHTSAAAMHNTAAIGLQAAATALQAAASTIASSSGGEGGTNLLGLIGGFGGKAAPPTQSAITAGSRGPVLAMAPTDLTRDMLRVPRHNGGSGESGGQAVVQEHHTHIHVQQLSVQSTAPDSTALMNDIATKLSSGTNLSRREKQRASSAATGRP